MILADKPAGITSHDMVARARHALGKRRVGHAGTLDPFATGLLILLVGRATRVQRYLMELPKTYEVVARFGATSTTGDTEGEITETGVLPDALTLPVGGLSQRPPAYSAVKVGGERAYAKARRGEEVVLDERPVTVHSFDLLWREGDRAGFRIVCSSGTYVRSLIADLGDAYCVELRRTAIGPFDVAGAWPGEGHATVLDLVDGLRPIMPVIALSEDEAAAAAHGRAVAGNATGAALLVDGGGAIAVAEAQIGGLVKPVVGFRG